jgi:nicotinate-nucleotide--dimethylbenzimidazole phosphoribosyltransferase
MIRDKIQHKIDQKTKPLGSLGKLEKIALQIGEIQNSLSPRLSKPTIVVFAADHGIAQEGVSAYPSEVTAQMVLNFLAGGAAINVFCKKNSLDLAIVDAGVNYDFRGLEKLLDAKIAFGTQSFLQNKAMTMKQLASCFENGRKVVLSIFEQGCNCIGFGEMGIGNTASASIIMSYLCGIPLYACVGKGTGLSDEQLKHKLKVLEQAQAFHGEIQDAKEVLATFGGFEIAQITGAILAASERNMIVLVDGFIASVAYLVAFTINPSIQKNAIFCHLSEEKAHKALLNYLKAEPILQLGMRLGEGTGCALAYPIIQNAVAFLNEMSSFESAGVSNKIEE